MTSASLQGEGESVQPGIAHVTPEDGPDGSRLRAHRALSVLAVVATSATAFEQGDALPLSWVVSVLLPIAFGGGVLLAGAVLAAHSERRLQRLDWLLLALGCLSISVLLAGNLYQHSGYTSDEAAFQQAAATLLLHGHDPYGVNLISSLTQFRVTPEYQTYTLSGGEATTLGYPALPTLLTAVAKLATNGWETAPVGNVVILLATMVLLFKLLEPHLRPLAVIAIVPMPMLFGMATAAMTEIVLAPLLLFVAYRWTSVGATGRLTRLQVWQAIALGLALATQQEAWFLVPFVVSGVFLLRERDLGRSAAAKLAGRYLGYALLAFFVVNLPFIVWGPRPWLAGVTTPLRQNALPLGQGLVDWTVYLGHGGGVLSAYNYAAAALLLGLFVVYVLDFKHLARALFVAPVLPLYVSTRPLCPYFIPMAGAMIVSVATLEAGSLDHLRPIWQPGRRWLRRGVRVACFVPAAIFVVLALAVPAPLQISVLGTRVVGGPVPSVFWLKLQVHNRSSHTLTPRFVTNKDGTSSAFWHQMRGPQTLAPGATRTYVIEAPDTTAMFGWNDAVALGAVTGSPATYSSAGRISAHADLTDLQPAQVLQDMRVGQPLTFTVQLRTVAGALVHRAGVRIALSQAIYNAWDGAKVRATINGSKPGASPVSALTNADGQAHFTVRNDFALGQPILFQSWILRANGSGYGRSSIVSVLWR